MRKRFPRMLIRAVILTLATMLVLTLPPAVDSVWAQDKKKTTESKEKRKKKSRKGKKREEEKAPTMADAIGNVTPVGRGHRKLVIPQFDPVTSKRSSTIKVSSVDREDEVTLRLQGLDVAGIRPGRQRNDAHRSAERIL